MESARGPPISISCFASVTRTRSPPATWRFRNPRVWRSACASARMPRLCPGWPRPGVPGAAWRRICCGPTIVLKKSGTSCHLRPSADRKKPASKRREGRRMAELDGPRLEPGSGPAEQLVVFLHGYGADGNDLIDIGRAWQQLLPEAAFVSPHAPRPCGQAPSGREWFPLTFRDPHERWNGVNAAAPILTQFLDAELGRRGLPPSALALVGFSQGTMMALHAGLRRPVAPAAIVGYSGMFVEPTAGGLDAVSNEIVARPPVLLVHGDRDDLIPPQALFHAAQALVALAI